MATLTVHADRAAEVIDRNIYGHFSEHLGRCVYEGLWVGEDSTIPNVRGIRQDVVEALKRMGIPNLRWPGGCFADEYHWMDGIGPKEERKRMVNTHWGGVVEDNSFGTHEFLDLCEQLGCEPYICGNMGSGTVREMQEWVEYMTFDGESPMTQLRRANGRQTPWKLKFFGVGNENWGCGGNMLPEYYASEFRRYNTYVRNFGGNRIFRIACGPNSADYKWTEVLMRDAGGCMDGLSLHYYTVPNNWEQKGPAVGFDEGDWRATMVNAWRMEELITKHTAIMDQYDPERRVALVVDEWGAWYDVEPGTNPGFLYQQNTMRDALVAGLTLNIFNNHSSRVRMANLAQLANVLQAVILTEGERMLLTPTYHVFRMYRAHQDARLLPIDLECERYGEGEGSVPALSASASVDGNGVIHVSLSNLDPHNASTLTVGIPGVAVATGEASVLCAPQMDAHNTFSSPDEVKEQPFGDWTRNAEGFTAALPPMSVTMFALRP